MYNLIQVQNRLKELPKNPQTMQYLTAASKGQNPEIPPYVALGEMQRREAMDSQMATAQGAAKGPTLTVAEQMESKAREKAMGLMALQQGRQASAAQQPVPQGGPAPENTPQPEQQEEAPAMMAQGGLARLPVDSQMFNYREGGVIGYAGPDGSVVGKKPPDAAAEAAVQEAQRTGDRDAMLMTLKKLAAAGYDTATLIPRAFMGVAEDLANTRLGRALGIDFRLPQAAYGGDRASVMPMTDRVRREAEGRLPSVLPTAAPASQQAARPMSKEDMEMRQAPAPEEGIAKLLPPPAPAAPRARPQAQQAPRAPQVPQAPQVPAAPPAPSELETILMGRVKEAPPKPMTDEQIIAQNAGLRPAGLSIPAGSEEMKRLEAMQKQYEASTADRGLEGLIAGLSGRAQGAGGMGSAYLSTQAANRAADMAQAELQNKMRATIEAARRGEDTTEFGRRTGIRAGETTRADALRKDQMDTAEKMFASQTTASTALTGQQLMAKTELEKARIMAAVRDASGGDSATMKKVIAAETAYERDPNVKNIMEQLKDPILMRSTTPAALAKVKLLNEDLNYYRQRAYASQQITLPDLGTPPSARGGEPQRPPAVDAAFKRYK